MRCIGVAATSRVGLSSDISKNSLLTWNGYQAKCHNRVERCQRDNAVSGNERMDAPRAISEVSYQTYRPTRGFACRDKRTEHIIIPPTPGIALSLSLPHRAAENGRGPPKDSRERTDDSMPLFNFDLVPPRRRAILVKSKGEGTHARKQRRERVADLRNAGGLPVSGRQFTCTRNGYVPVRSREELFVEVYSRRAEPGLAGRADELQQTTRVEEYGVVGEVTTSGLSVPGFRGE
ncbi:hypothetical protein V8E53_000479 [Lactarius tabidus]